VFVDSLTALKNNVAGLEKKMHTCSKNESADAIKANNTIAYLNSVIGSFSNYLTFLGILIGILALVVPFATYQYAVKPSREILKDLEGYFEKRLESYLWENRKNQVDNAINTLKRGTIEEKNNAVSFLTFTQHEGLSDEQLFNIYSFLKKAKIESNLKSQLAFLLTHRKTEFASDFFNSPQILDDPHLKNMSYVYFAKTGYRNNYSGIKILLQHGVSPETEYITLFNILNQYNSDDLSKVLNDSAIIDLLSNEALLAIDKILPQLFVNLNLDIEYDNSYIKAKVQELDK